MSRLILHRSLLVQNRKDGYGTNFSSSSREVVGDIPRCVAKLTKVGDGVHVGALSPRNFFNTVIVEGSDGDVVIDAGPPCLILDTQELTP